MDTQALLEAVNQICLTRGINPEDVFEALERALAEAYKKEHPTATVRVEINPKTGSIMILVKKEVVKQVQDPDTQVSLDEAKNLVPDAKIGDSIEFEIPIGTLGRITASMTKRMLQRVLRDAELKAFVRLYEDKVGKAISGKILFLRKDRIIVELERGNAIFPLEEQVETEFYEIGKRYKFLVKEVINEEFNRRVILSRKDPQFIKALFELEVPELRSGQVEITNIAREAGVRTKVAVKALDESIDPLGTLIGPKGIRINAVMSEIAPETVDVIKWAINPADFIRNALAPAKTLSAKVDPKKKKATVYVAPEQYEVALGKNGVNVRLAEEITGYTIDIVKKETEGAAK